MDPWEWIHKQLYFNVLIGQSYGHIFTVHKKHDA